MRRTSPLDHTYASVLSPVVLQYILSHTPPPNSAGPVRSSITHLQWHFRVRVRPLGLLLHDATHRTRLCLLSPIQLLLQLLLLLYSHIDLLSAATMCIDRRHHLQKMSLFLTISQKHYPCCRAILLAIADHGSDLFLFCLSPPLFACFFSSIVCKVCLAEYFKDMEYPTCPRCNISVSSEPMKNACKYVCQTPPMFRSVFPDHHIPEEHKRRETRCVFCDTSLHQM